MATTPPKTPFTLSQSKGRLALLLLGCALLLTLPLSCHPPVTGAPCQSDENCPKDQFCNGTLCEEGPRTGHTDGGGIGGGGGSNGDAGDGGETDAGDGGDGGIILVGEATFGPTACYDNI